MLSFSVAVGMSPFCAHAGLEVVVMRTLAPSPSGSPCATGTRLGSTGC